MVASVSAVDQIVALRLVMGSLPSASQWYAAVHTRRDGSSAAGVFTVLDALRMELLGRIGRLARGEHIVIRDRLLAFPFNATNLDVLTALELTILRLPRREAWESAIGMRSDGTTVEGIFSMLSSIRADLHQCLAEFTQPTLHRRSSSQT